MDYLTKSLFGTIVIVLVTISAYFYAGNKYRLWGYKTPMSLKNEMTFAYANRLAKKCSLWVVATFVISEILLYNIYCDDHYKAYSYSTNLLLVLSLVIIPIVEINLRLKFDKQGNIKK